MAFRAVVVVALVALVSAGYDPNYMNFMQQMMMMHQMQNMGNMGNTGNMGNMGNMGNGHQNGGGCDPSKPGSCNIPRGIDVGEYMKQQQEAQQYESQQMAERLKAQFEKAMKEVTMRKHRYAMSVMTEFTTMCACAEQSINIYQTMFVENAKSLNMTDVIDLNDITMLPYEAKNLKEARELIFAGIFRALCTSVGQFMAFVQEVENNIPIFQNNPVTPSGK